MNATAPRPLLPGLLRDLDRPADVIANITPNWFASVMGTGIVATAAAGVPKHVAGLHVFAIAFWLLATAMLVALTVLTALHWMHHPATARRHLHDPIIGHFYGAPPMALLTVGAGTLLVGRYVLGERLAVDVDWVLWFAGTVGGLASAAVVPFVLFARHRSTPAEAFGGWLMPVVPPMVAASTGALLAPHAPAGQARLVLVVACYAMFGLSVVASAVLIPLIWRRLAVHDVGPARLVPTVWIVLGPLGQSITAVNLLAGVVDPAAPAPYRGPLRGLALGYGLPVWGFAVGWAAFALVITVRTVRADLPFSLTWWSFTFPVGTLVTGTTALALRTGAEPLRWIAAAVFVALLLAWVTVAARTAHGCWNGRLFRPA